MTSSPRILIVEDEAKTASTVALYLRNAGMDPAIARTGDSGLALAEAGGWDLIVLDIMLPGIDGLEICRRLQDSDVPIILLTARTTEQDTIDGLELGADDYVPKPFSPRELVARVQAVLRRAQTCNAAQAAPVLRGPLLIDPTRREVRVDEAVVDLTPAEFDLLKVLADAPGRVWTRRQLIDAVFPDGRHVLDRTIDVHVKNLRHKIEPDRTNPRFICTVFGVGYRFPDNI